MAKLRKILMPRVLQTTLIVVGLFVLISTAAMALAHDDNPPTWLYFTSDFALYRMYPDGSHVELLMDDVKMFGGDWSPDHQWLIFSANEDGYGFADLYRFNVYTRRLELIAATDLSDGFVEWSPDHQWMVFEADSEEYYQGYYLMRPNGRGQRELLGDVRLPNYVGLSPDGEWVLYYTGWEELNHIFVKRIDSGESRQLTHAATDSYVWRTTPDNEWILYTRQEAGHQNIYRMRWDGSEQQNLTHAIDEWIDGYFLSPDGQWLIVTHRDDTNTLYRIRIDGTETTALMTLPERYAFQTWSSDSEWLYFGTGFETGADIYRLNILSATVEQLTESENADLFEWLSPDGRWMWYASTPLDEPDYEMFILDLENHSRQSLGVFSTSFRPQLVSEDGEWVYVQGTLDEDYFGLYRMHADGTDVQRVFEMSAYFSVIGWSSPVREDFQAIPIAAAGFLMLGGGGLLTIFNPRK